MTADVCLILEGTYPFVAGGVSSWVHDLITDQADLRFHAVCLTPDPAPREPVYPPPANLVGLEVVPLAGGLAPGRRRGARRIHRALAAPLGRLLAAGGLDDLADILAALGPDRAGLGHRLLLDSPAAWDSLTAMYRDALPHGAFLDYFWTWRAQAAGMFTVLLAPLPPARVYHTISTGYAGLMAARARLDTGRPVLITEHGIYTNERRIEITMAEWLSGESAPALAADRPRRELRDLWIDAFLGMSHCVYQAAGAILTLYGDNQRLQIRDGAPADRLRVIPNGIDLARYGGIVRDDAHPPTMALIGRVVPIKDVKTFIRAVARVRAAVPDVAAYVLGPTEEDPGYDRECRALAAELNLDGTLHFPGRVALDDWLGRIDVNVLTSISEAQPLVILEAGAAGVPTVATDVGACREMILGPADEDPPLGAGGAITALANPAATAEAVIDLLRRPEWRAACGRAIAERVRRAYNKPDLVQAYGDLYRRAAALPGGA